MREELIYRAKQAKSAEELISLAEKENITLSKDDADALFSRLNSSGSLKDDELESVSGGGCGSSSSDGSSTREEDSGYGLKTGDRAHILWGELCPCGGDNVEILYCCGGYGTAAERYMTRCFECGSEIGHWAYELRKIL